MLPVSSARRPMQCAAQRTALTAGDVWCSHGPPAGVSQCCQSAKRLTAAQRTPLTAGDFDSFVCYYDAVTQFRDESGTQSSVEVFGTGRGKKTAYVSRKEKKKTNARY